jgi:hypothetical protein
MNFRLLFLSLIFTFAFSRPGEAQEAIPEGASDPKRVPAHIRVWVMVFDEKAPISIAFKGKDAESVTLLEAPGVQPTRGFYVEVPKGSGEIVASAGEIVLASATVDLLPDDHRTVLISRKGGKLNLQVLQDPLPGQKDFPPVVRLLNFGTGRSAEVTLGAQNKVIVPENQMVISQVPAQTDIPLRVVLPDPSGGPPAISSTDIDSRTSPSWSLVVIPDYRGKLRPRVSPDGRE